MSAKNASGSEERNSQSIVALDSGKISSALAELSFRQEGFSDQESIISGFPKRAERRSYSDIDNYERELGFEIDRTWLAELALHTQVVVKASEICYEHGRILYSCLSDYISRSQAEQERIAIVETGTARGFSSLCMAKALADADCQGVILTFDVLPHNVPMIWNCIDDLDKAKTRSELLTPWGNVG